MTEYHNPTPRQVSNATTDRLMQELKSTNPWAVIDQLERTIDALQREIVKLIGELDETKKQLPATKGNGSLKP